MNIALIGLVFAGMAFVAEAAISAGLGRPLHRWTDSLSALSLSLLTGLIAPFGKAFLFLLYIPLHEALALREWHGGVLDWVMAVLAYEFVGYWFHRFSHRTNLGWAVHMAHHQSEELNLSTALRTAPLRSLLDWPTLLPLALLGIPPEAMVLLYIQHVAGQYWLHVQWIRHLGPLEWVLNTPSHHRVHHGCDEGYQDANYGASLIVWDRLFGTLVPETHPATYGVVHPVPGSDPFRATFYPFVQVYRQSRNWRAIDRVRVWLAPPGWTPTHGVPLREPPAPRRAARPTHLPTVLWHFLTASLLLLAVPQATFLSTAVRVFLAVVGLWSLRAFGLALEHRNQGRVETLLHILALSATALLLPWPAAVGAALLALGTAVVGFSPRVTPEGTPVSSSPTASPSH